MAACPNRARFDEPMLLLRTDRLLESANLVYKVTLDGYGAIAFKAGLRFRMTRSSMGDIQLWKDQRIKWHDSSCPRFLAPGYRVLSWCSSVT